MSAGGKWVSQKRLDLSRTPSRASTPVTDVAIPDAIDKDIPPHEWEGHCLRDHPDILELRERLCPLTENPSYASLPNAETTDVKQVLSHNQVTQLILSYLKEEGLSKSLDMLERESNIILENSLLAKETPSPLPGLLSIGIKDILTVFEPPSTDELEEQGIVVYDYDATSLEDEDYVVMWEEGPDTEDNITFVTIDKKEHLETATLNKAVEYLTSGRNLQFKSFRDMFLSTYSSFTSPEAFLQKLYERYTMKHPDQKAQKVIHMRVVIILKAWLEDHFADVPEIVVAKMNAFIDTIAQHGHQELARTLRNALAKSQQDKDKRQFNLDMGSAAEPKVPRSIFSPTLRLDDIVEEEIARQLSLINHRLYSAIQPSELLGMKWYTQPYNCLNLSALSERLNEVSCWVASTILREPRFRSRVAVLSRFLRIAWWLLEMNCFGMAMALYAGLSCEPVHRLKHTFHELTPEFMKILNQLEDFANPAQSYANYRSIYRQTRSPCVPYMGVHLKDLTFLEQSLPARVGKRINFTKSRALYHAMEHALRHQDLAYRYLPVQQIIVLLEDKSQYIQDPSQMYKISLTIEPRGAESVE